MASLGKIDDLVSQQALDQLDALLTRLGITKDQMAIATDQALKMNAALGDTRSIQELQAAQERAAVGMQTVITANNTVIIQQKEVVTQTQAVTEAVKAKAIAEADTGNILKRINDVTANNVKLLVDQKLQLTQLTTQLKDHLKTIALSSESTAVSSEKTIELTRRQFELKESTAQLTLVIRQQTKEQLSANAKEVASAEAKVAKMIALAERQAKAQFPASPGYSSNVTSEPTAPAAKYEPIITGEENMQIAVSKSTTAIAEENTALLEQQDVLAGLSVEYRANLELLLALKLERSANASELKALNVEDAVSGERAVFLTAEQLKLNMAIGQTNLTLSQQTKQMLAADTSTAQQQSRLDELRVAYNNLTLAEQQNIEIGGVWLAEIEVLDAAVKEAAVAQGIHNKNVGNYTTATALADKVSAQFVRQLTRMAAQFLLVTLIFGAVQWLYDYIKGLDMFTGRLSQAYQNYLMLNRVMAAADKIAGDHITTLKLLYATATDVSLADKDRIAAAEELKKLYPDTLKNSSDAAIMNGKEAESIEKITEDLIKEAQAEAALAEVKDIATKRNYIADQKDKVRAAESAELKRGGNPSDAIIPSSYAITPGALGVRTSTEVRKLVHERAVDAMADYNTQDKILDNQQKLLIKRAGLANIAKVIETKGPKGPKGKKPLTPTDTGNTDLLENNRIKLAESQKINKAVLDNEENSYDSRMLALDKYLSDSRALIKNSEAIIDADTKLRAQQRINMKLQLFNKSKDIDIEALKERQKVAEDEITKQKKILSELLTLQQQSEQDQLDVLNQGAIVAAQKLNDRKENLIIARRLQFSEGKITEKRFNQDLLAINDRYNVQRLAQEIAVQQSILAIKKATKERELDQATANSASPEELAKISGNANKGINSTNNTISGLFTQLKEAKSKQKNDALKGKDKPLTPKEKLQNILDYSDKAIEGLNIAGDLIAANAQAKIDALEKEFSLIERNGEAEKIRIGNSLLSEKEKAREQNIVDAQVAQQRLRITLQENEIKKKQAEFDKAQAIARIIQGTAVAIVESLGNPFMVAIVAALGAAQLAVAIATPLPQFKDGGTVKKDGNIITGEAGTELRIDPSGATSFTKGYANVSYAKAGTKIINNQDLVKMLGKPDQIQYVINATNDNKRVERLLEENNTLQRRAKRPVVNVFNDKFGSTYSHRNY